ncbi:MAG: SGNH/GDSL hydrolase family protein [Candidatus Omnitrophota bacterium]
MKNTGQMIIKKCVLICFGLLLIVAAEGVCRIILTDSKLNILEAVFTLCQEDSSLIWRQRKNIKTKFQGQFVKTNSEGLRNDSMTEQKQPRECRIICLGASSTFGWGVSGVETYPAKLQGLLSRLKQGRNYTVINAGQIGYTTFQGKKLLEEYLLKYSPDIITVSYILNDIDHCRFFRNDKLSDKELRPLSQTKINIKNLITQSSLCFLIRRGVAGVFGKNKRMAIAGLKRKFKFSNIRVSAGDYRKNLEEIVCSCNTRKIKLLFIKMPVNLPLPGLSEQEKKIINSGNTLSDHYFSLGVQDENKKDFDNALIAFQKALDYQVFECYKDGFIYQQIMEEVADKHAVPLVDTQALFKDRIPEEELFNGPEDPIHPNAKGHQLIAEGVYQKILDLKDMAVKGIEE